MPIGNLPMRQAGVGLLPFRISFIMPAQGPFMRHLTQNKNAPAERGISVASKLQNAGQSKVGDSTPRILCSFGEVVVYCMWIFLSGKMYGAAPKAASAASWKPDRISFFLPG